MLGAHPSLGAWLLLEGRAAFPSLLEVPDWCRTWSPELLSKLMVLWMSESQSASRFPATDPRVEGSSGEAVSAGSVSDCELFG